MNNSRNSLSFATRSFLAIALVALLASTAAFASTPQGTFEKTFQVSGPVDLEVLTRSGDITVPAETALRTHSGSGNQTIEGIHGNADLQTGSGDMRLASLTGAIHLQTGSGNVRAHDISGSVRGGAGSGDIEVDERSTGNIDLHTGSGNVTVRGIQGAFRADAGSGDITAEGKQSGAWEIRTGSGNVHVRLPGNSAFDADISTSSGTIDVDSPIEMTVQGRVQESRKTIHGKVRGGGPLLSVRTGSGDIQIQ